MSSSNNLTRRSLLSLTGLGAASLLASCASSRPISPSLRLDGPVARPMVDAPPTGRSPELDAMYGEIFDGGYVIPAVPYWKIPERFYRQQVIDPTGQPAGSIVVDTPNRFLYLVEPGGTAMRYGVSIGREGFAWQGTGVIQWRQKWPKWTPPDEMVARQPELVQYSIANGGMPPGLKNPLGARALYISQNGEDTLYRLHGNPDWSSTGKAVSSGCVRLMNQDIIDLYERVPNKAKIQVWQ